MITRDRWGSFPELARGLPAEAFAIVDARLADLHPAVPRALRGVGSLRVEPGERAKSFAQLERLLFAARGLSRHGTMLAVGGGTLGDLATVAAHLHKRGVRLVLVPTTLLGAVDSSLGGKGALNLGAVKNAVGVFHEPYEVWICLELFATLGKAQVWEGWVEALKMAACLDRALWRSARERPLSLRRIIAEGRRLKRAICERDPTDLGERQLLNFGHSFGHALEALSGHRLSHGAAVRLGTVCALDVGRALGVTPAKVAAEIQAGFEPLGHRPIRVELARWLRGVSVPRLRGLLLADKKVGADGKLRMVLLSGLAAPRLQSVEGAAWAPLLPAWRGGRAP
ncbi:MAG: 3-dehydroquinate synthase [Myxococcales bacterium]